jgi:hypothetical protein
MTGPADASRCLTDGTRRHGADGLGVRCACVGAHAQGFGAVWDHGGVRHRLAWHGP